MSANKTYTQLTESPGFRNHRVVMRSSVGSVSVRDVYIISIFYYSPDYNSDQVILHKSLANRTRTTLLQDGYRALLSDEETCAGFASIHPQAWSQIVVRQIRPTNTFYGMPASFYMALTNTFQSHGVYPPRMDLLTNAVESWIYDQLTREFPGTTTQDINQRDQQFMNQQKTLEVQGAKLVSAISFSQFEQELDR